jgi:hypothetical protein
LVTNQDGHGIDVLILDAKPEITELEDSIEIDGDILQIQIGSQEDAPYIGFDFDQAKAFIEACQEILDRYDKD